jgi:hypothetical protein
MASPVVLSGVSLEAQALQVAQLLQGLEQEVVPLDNAEVPNNVTISYEADGGNVAISFTLPVTLSSSSTGMILTAVPYLA